MMMMQKVDLPQKCCHILLFLLVSQPTLYFPVGEVLQGV